MLPSSSLKRELKKKNTHTHWHFRSIPINRTEKSLLVSEIRILHLILHFCYFSLHLPIINNSLISCASIFAVNILWCTSLYFLDTSYTLWRWSHKVTIFLVKSKATCLRLKHLVLHETLWCRVFPWALWAADCSWGELLLGKQTYRQLFAFLGTFTMSRVLLEISLWKLRETEEFCTTVSSTTCKCLSGNTATSFNFSIKTHFK